MKKTLWRSLLLFFLLAAAAGVGTVSVSAANIPAGAGQYGGHYYYVFPGKTASSYGAAVMYCENLGGHLAVISSAGENSYLYHYMAEQGYPYAFFGLFKSSGKWGWVDGSPLNYTNWNKGEPEGQSYGRYKKNMGGVWVDDYWNTFGSPAFICEWDETSKSIAKASVTLSKTLYTYDGKTKTPAVKKVVLGGKTLKAGTDYTVSYAGASGIGTAYVYVRGKGSYKDTAVKTYEIRLAKPTISVASTQHGQAVLTSKKIKGATGYQFVYTNQSNGKSKKTNSSSVKASLTGLSAGKYYKCKVRAYAKISGKTYYSDYSSAKKIKIYQGISITKTLITLGGFKSNLHVIYNGKAQEPQVKVKYGILTLKKGTDYTVKYSSNKNAGTATVTITGKGKYYGTVKKYFIIDKRVISAGDVGLAKSAYVYTGQAQKPAVLVVYNKKALVINTDYTVKYTANTNAGTATATVSGKGNYTGTVKKKFTIKQRNLSTAEITLAEKKYAYTGKAISPAVTVKYQGKKIGSSNYEVRYSNNVNIGTAKVVVTGKKNFTGKVTLTFEITKALVSPVPEGCKFSKSTKDEGGKWTGYHDINRNVSKSTPVYAIADGTVVFKQAHTNYVLTSYGNWMEFTSSDGVYKARYCHLDRFNGVQQKIPSSDTKRQSGGTSIVLATKKVKAGDILGYVGTTGNSSGVHLHFELYENGVRIDPTTVFPELK